MEIFLIPIIVIFTIVSVTTSAEYDERVKNIVNGLLVVIGWVIIIHSILKLLNIDVKQVPTWNYLEGLAIEPITWIINLPLVILAIPMTQYDLIDNFRKPKKNAIRILFHSIEFLIGWAFFLSFTGLKLHRFVKSVHTGGLRGLRLQIFINSKVPLWKVKIIQYLYRYMLMPRNEYKNGNRSIPIHVECRDADSLEVLISPYEMRGLMDEYNL